MQNANAQLTHERVDKLLGKMALEEKIGQLAQISGAEFMPGPKAEDIIRQRGTGSVLWLNDAKRFNALQKIAIEESPSGIPILFALDVIHGYKTVFPVPLAMAADNVYLPPFRAAVQAGVGTFMNPLCVIQLYVTLRRSRSAFWCVEETCTR